MESNIDVERDDLTSGESRVTLRVNEFHEGGAQAYGWSSYQVRPSVLHPASLYRRASRGSYLHISSENARVNASFVYRSQICVMFLLERFYDVDIAASGKKCHFNIFILSIIYDAD